MKHYYICRLHFRPVKKPLVPEPVAKLVEPSPLLPKSETSKPNEGLLTALPKSADTMPIGMPKPVRPEINTEQAKVEPNKPVMAEPKTSSSSSWGKEMDQMVKLDAKSGPKTEPAVKPESKPLIKPETKKPEVEKIKPVESKAAEPLTKPEPAIPSKVTAATPLSPPKTAPPLPVSQPLKATARPTPTPTARPAPSPTARPMPQPTTARPTPPPPLPSKSPVKEEPKKSEIKVQEEKKQQENGKKPEPKVAPLTSETVNFYITYMSRV